MFRDFPDVLTVAAEHKGKEINQYSVPKFVDCDRFFETNQLIGNR